MSQASGCGEPTEPSSGRLDRVHRLERNNDVSRYGEVLGRSLLHKGLRHYFLVTFPQETGRAAPFPRLCFGSGEDIVVFEYVMKNNRETGPVLVGFELERAADIDDRLARMAGSRMQRDPVPAGLTAVLLLM